MNLNENIDRIKQVMGLIVEQSEDELRKTLEDKFPDYNFNGKIEKKGDNIVVTKFSKKGNGNYTMTYNPSDNFYTTEFIDGPYKGKKQKNWIEDGEDKEDDISKSEMESKFEEKIKNFPCLNIYDPDYIRQTNDGKIIVGYEWGDNNESIIYFNLDDSTYTNKGGPLDGQQGKFTCNGTKVNWETIKLGTNKTVTKKYLPYYFSEVTSSNPITIGMRDRSPEPENGLIYQLQQKLKELNLYTGEPDGQFGPLTHKAVIAYQKQWKDTDGNPLVVDGKVGPKTIESLGLSD